MTQLYDRMVRFFEEDDWYFQPFENTQALRLAFKGETMEWACIAQTQEEDRVFVFYSVCPMQSLSEQRMAVAEFMVLANYGMIVGNFEMDFSDGEVRFKTSIGLGEADLSDELMKVAVYTNVFSMDRYLSGLLGVMQGILSPRDAVDLAELGSKNESE